jgi:hypothetical protein
VATDLIHHLWCQHDEKYGAIFLKEPHRSKKNCLFLHTTQHQTDDSSCSNEKIEIIRQHGSANQPKKFRYFAEDVSSINLALNEQSFNNHEN